MTALGDIELRRARWRRALEYFAVHTTKREGFATGGLCSRLRNGADGVGALLVLLPEDPEAGSVSFNDEFVAWLESQSRVQVDRQLVTLGDVVCRTAHAVALATVAQGRNGPWENYVAVYRSGILEMSLGQHSVRTLPAESGREHRAFLISSIVVKVWILLQLWSAVVERSTASGPWQLTVALRDTKSALLRGRGVGWPTQWEAEGATDGCRDEHLLWHIELDASEGAADLESFAYAVGDRIEGAWGKADRFYLDRTGDRIGSITWQHG